MKDSKLYALPRLRIMLSLQIWRTWTTQAPDDALDRHDGKTEELVIVSIDGKWKRRKTRKPGVMLGAPSAYHKIREEALGDLLKPKESVGEDSGSSAFMVTSLVEYDWFQHHMPVCLKDLMRSPDFSCSESSQWKHTSYTARSWLWMREAPGPYSNGISALSSQGGLPAFYASDLPILVHGIALGVSTVILQVCRLYAGQRRLAVGYRISTMSVL